MRYNDIKKILREEIESTEKIKGGYADGMNIEDIAERHGVSVEQIESELEKGIEVEYEHTNDREASREIALDHLYEMPNYYTELMKIEKGHH